MKSGDIVFVQGRGILARLIRFFDKGTFSHCAIAVSDNKIIEAQYFAKVRIDPFDPTEYNYYEIIDLGLTKEQRNRIVGSSLKRLGKRYDYGQIVWYVLKDVFHLKGDNRFNNPNNLICSELAYIVLEESGVMHMLGEPRDGTFRGIDLTPNQLYDLLKYLSNKKATQKITRREG
ncbi:YiiX/YebB-like N1pC/P60 family cysteine hydrolase [Priestia megaterium]|uniref:YiiX/YebB-like N1pC/P60 family cysteine hydrolase n=1 Tax=Priestia megaterium TaxID=1404 RepID=UPI002FFED9CF